ncbi:flagellar motor protein MotB [Granulosicoccus antarcticus]|uniref:Motility protein B n=1 Tax=Granulosicoccus antarcticus IMCC3135 TaxID=1192854 RepID=A0A2Z2NPD2_9GAMM|nr:flagellar motor protein MotB [Granulosicoccus antarcticus]ASJ71791.1 Motility protein B [Granulosicoccus antarcticus IMCC3135]
MDDDCECEECEAGAPAWMATFADLMSLLMCFFVLLLSFSEMDIQKYKQVAGSMKFAFGVQREVKADTIPRGTSVIKQEFSPGKPDPSIMKIMKQQTADDSKAELKINPDVPEAVAELLSKIEESLQDEIERELLEVIVSGDGVMIRVREADSFPSGSATLQRSFMPVLDKLQTLLDESEGRIIVAGHTDNVPISTSNYPSNWVLSAARAASVVHYLSEIRMTDPARIEIRAYSDTQPIADNDSPENRAKNRRIEINIGVPDPEEEY